MTYTQAIMEIAAYYDQPMYLPESKEVHPKIAALKKWMVDNINEIDLYNFRDRIFYEFKFFPKIAELMNTINQNNTAKFEIQAEASWQLLINKSSSNDVFITDEASAYVVSGYGSWHDFCQERDGNREWTHKNYITRYVSFKESGITFTPYALQGSMKHHYGLSFTGVSTNIIGHDRQNENLLENNSEKIKIDNLISASFKKIN